MGYKTLQDPQFAGLANYDPRALFAQLPTPAYVIDEERLRKNGEVLAALAERTGCRVLLAQKAFSNYDFYPLLSRYLAGTEASGLYEARLGKEEMPQGEIKAKFRKHHLFFNPPLYIFHRRQFSFKLFR